MSGPDAGKIGSRVSMLIREDDGSHREMLGRLLTLSSILKKDASEVTFAPTQVISWRVVPEQTVRRPTSHRIREIERAANATWPSVEVVIQGGWELRASSGFTQRANSVLPVGRPPFGEPSGELTAALKDVVDFYRSRNLIPRFQVPLPSYQALDMALDEEGWQSTLAVSVQICDLLALASSPEHEVEIAPLPGDEWLALQERPLGRDGLAVLTGGSPFFATIREADPTTGEYVVAAIGRGAAFEGWCGITAIRTAAQFQRQGLAKSIVRALAQQAARNGASRAFLQVSADNDAALALYQRLGFREHHTYNYRSLV